MKVSRAAYLKSAVWRTLIGGYPLGLKNITVLSVKQGMEKLPDQTVLRRDMNKHLKTDEDANRLRRAKARQVLVLLLLHLNYSLFFRSFATSFKPSPFKVLLVGMPVFTSQPLSS